MRWLKSNPIIIRGLANSHDKKYLFKVAFFLMLMIGLFPLAAQAKYGGGAGEPNDPYLIYTAEQMNEIGLHQEDWNKYFKLMADIDLGQYTATEFNVIGYRVTWNDERPFAGFFDGNGKCILNFTYMNMGYKPVEWAVGIFGYVKGGEIKDLELVGPNIHSESERTGSLVGSLSYGSIINCHVAGGCIFGRHGAGGLVGDSSGLVSFCSAECDVSGEAHVGGLAMSNWGEVRDCNFEGTVLATAAGAGGLAATNTNAGLICDSVSIAEVSGTKQVGGVAGANWGKIINCGATGRASGTEEVGGLVGGNNGTVTHCYARSDVSGTNWVGGFAGQNGVNYGDVVFGGYIYDSCATGSVSAGSHVGGLVGYNDYWGTISRCYAAGPVSGVSDVGGLVGSSRKDSISDCFWDTAATGQTVSAGGTAKPTAEMQDPNTYINAGWHFVGQPASGPNYDWAEAPSGGYPILWWQLSPLPTLPTFSGGTGQPIDPYLIATAEELNGIGHNPRLMGKCFRLVEDIDLAGVKFFSIGSKLYPFTGTFSGDGKRISNFNYSGSGADGAGLFVFVEYAQISDLKLIDPNVDCPTYDSVGTLAGRSIAVIRNCAVEGGRVSGMDDVGILVGSNRGSTIDCYATGVASGHRSVGGLIGSSSRMVQGCWASAQVSGIGQFAMEIGGLVGRNAGKVIDSFAECVVTGGSSLGGLVGHNNYDANVSGCYASGKATGTHSVGGLVGLNFGYHSYWYGPRGIFNCYALTETEGEEQVGGLAGSNSGCISFCYSAGKVHGQDQVGGLVGNPVGGSVFLSYYDIDASAQSSSPGNAGKTTGEMMSRQTFRGWNYSNAWVLNDGNDYPRLTWEQTPGTPITGEPYRYWGGTGQVNDPYQIWTAEQFAHIAFRPTDYAYHFLLMNDIDLSEIPAEMVMPIGTPDMPFTGVFDGNGCVIRNFSRTEEWRGCMGVFGYVAAKKSEAWDGPRRTTVYTDGIIANLGVVDANVAGQTHVGGLVGYSQGTIARCFANGRVNVTGQLYVGGLVGFTRGNVSECFVRGQTRGGSTVGGLVGCSYSNSTIRQCFTSGSVTGDRDVGGLAGWNSGAIVDCYARGSVDGKQRVAGLAATNYGDLAHCYCACTIAGDENVGGLSARSRGGKIASCFWDTNISALTDGVADQEPDPVGAIGKTTAEMKMTRTSMVAGWDFVGESVNGIEDIWCICEGVDYPKLTWQFVTGDFDDDDRVDLVDFAIFASRWLGTDSSFWCAGGGTDFTNDGVVYFDDLRYLAENWLQQ